MFFSPLFHGGFLFAKAARTEDGSEEWGYVQVRPSNLHFLFYFYFMNFNALFAPILIFISEFF